jgi:hypothetical protein
MLPIRVYFGARTQDRAEMNGEDPIATAIGALSVPTPANAGRTNMALFCTRSEMAGVRVISEIRCTAAEPRRSTVSQRVIQYVSYAICHSRP